MSSPSILLSILLLVLHSLPVLSLLPGGEPSLLHPHQPSNRSVPAATSFLSASAAVSAVSGTLRFTPVTREAPWSARSIGAVELFTRPLSYKGVDSRTTTTIAANAFVLHGGSGAGNDVWVSADHGRTWQLAAGVTIDDQSAADPAFDTSFTNYLAPAVLIDHNSNIFRIGGRQRTNGQDYYYDDVWTSTNGLKWTNAAENSAAPFDNERYYAGAIATSKGELILQGGTFNNFQQYKGDVWSSLNGGRTWKVQTEMAEFGTRGIGVLLQSQHNDRLAGKDILYLIGGQNEKDNNNEGQPHLSHRVFCFLPSAASTTRCTPTHSFFLLCLDFLLTVWTSSDSGKTWQVLNIHSPWPQRDAFNGEITKDGVIVISSGLGDKDVGLALEAPINDVWVSLNGQPAITHSSSLFAIPSFCTTDWRMIDSLCSVYRRLLLGPMRRGRRLRGPIPPVHHAGRGWLLVRGRRTFH